MIKRFLTVSLTAVMAVVVMATAAQAVTSGIFHNNLKLFGRAFNPAGYFTIHDDTVITGELNVKGNVSDSKGNLTLDDTVAITGNEIVEGNAEVKGEIYNSNDVVTVNDDLAVTGAFSVNTMVTPTSEACPMDGRISYDSSYLYVCVGDTWKKVALENL